MMKHTMPTRQKGIALVIGLLMLVILTLLGVSTFSNSHIQERSASNARLQSMAFETASAGASNAIDFFINNRDTSGYLPDDLCGSPGHTGWVNATNWINVGSVGTGNNTNLRQRLYCLADQYPGSTERPARSEVFVLSRGEVYAPGATIGTDNPIASRDIEVRIDIGRDINWGQGCGAICFPGCGFDADASTFPSSNSFQVDGNGMPAISGGCTTATDAILDEVRDDRMGNYEGGIETGGANSPWDSPTNTETFRSSVEQAAMADTSCSNCYHSGDLTTSGNEVFGTLENMQITYVDGDLTVGGTLEGAGILLVKGNIYWNGTINYRGLIVALGGHFDIDGGGMGGNPGDFNPESGGTLVVLDAYDGDTQKATFGDASFYNQGGGTAYWKHNCDALMAAQAEMLDSGFMPTEDSGAFWEPACEFERESVMTLGPEEFIIASWRENIGWRETFFGSTP